MIVCKHAVICTVNPGCWECNSTSQAPYVFRNMQETSFPNQYSWSDLQLRGLGDKHHVGLEADTCECPPRTRVEMRTMVGGKCYALYTLSLGIQGEISVGPLENGCHWRWSGRIRAHGGCRDIGVWNSETRGVNRGASFVTAHNETQASRT